jgi:hypothetical protein
VVLVPPATLLACTLAALLLRAGLVVEGLERSLGVQVCLLVIVLVHAVAGKFEEVMLARICRNEFATTTHRCSVFLGGDAVLEWPCACAGLLLVAMFLERRELLIVVVVQVVMSSRAVVMTPNHPE